MIEEGTDERQKYPYYKIRNKSEEIEIIRKKSKMPSICLKKKKSSFVKKKEKVNKKTCPISLTGFIHWTNISACWVLGYNGDEKQTDPCSIGTYSNG